MRSKRIAVSIFSGAGGLDLGFEYAGFFIPVAVEFNRQAAYTYAQNHGCTIINAKMPADKIEAWEPVLLYEDIRNVTGEQILQLCEKITGTKEIDILLGGPSCQSWSVAGKRLGDKDERGQMIYEYLRLLKELRPKSFLFENVKGLISKKFMPIFQNLLVEFEKLGYDVSYRLMNSFDYGIAQTRERVIVVGIRKGERIFEFPSPLPYKLVLKDVIGDLPAPQVYRKDAPENKIYEVPKNILGFKGKRVWDVDPHDFIPADKEAGKLFIRQGILPFVDDGRGVTNHLYFDNVKECGFESSTRPVFLEKPSPTITAHSRCTHILLNHQTKDFGFSPRYLSRNRQRQWDEAGFTVVGDGRQQALHPEPAHFDIRNHTYKEYPAFKKELLSKIPEGGNWRDLPEQEAAQYLGGALCSGGGKTGFLRKLCSEKPSPTILASMEQKLAEFCAPEKTPRRLTVRECMRIQGFPDWFVLYGSLSAQYMQVGNAVPVVLAYCLAKQLAETLDI